MIFAGILTISLIAAVAVVFFLTLWIISLRRVVPTNMVHIVQSGKATVSYGKGKVAGNVYYDWPSWMPLIGVAVSTYPESIFQINLKDYEAYDSARLPFVVDVASYFRVDDANIVAQRVSTFDELKSQLVNVLQGAVRRILSKTPLEETLHERSKFSAEFTKEVSEQIAEWGVVTVKPIEFMDIRDSSKGQVIHDIMAKEQSRIEMESRITVAENKKEAQNKEIDAARQVSIAKEDARRQVGVRQAEADKEIGIAKEISQQEVQTQQKVTVEREMAVKQVNEVRKAEIDRQVAEVKAEQDKKVAIISIEAERDAQIIAADGEKKAQITKAEGIKDSSVLEADGIKAIGEAKAAAERAMLQAPVDTQISLAKEIGENLSYQQYLITIRQVEAQEVVGKEMAKALADSDLKVIANAGDVQGGLNSLVDVLGTKGGTAIGGMLSAIAQTPEGAALVNKITGSGQEK